MKQNTNSIKSLYSQTTKITDVIDNNNNSMKIGYDDTQPSNADESSVQMSTYSEAMRELNH